MPQPLTDLAQILLNGMAIGGLYAMLAIGYALVFGTLRFVNFAHGDICMVGAYLVLALGTLGLPLWASLSLGATLAGLLSATLFWLLYRPLAPRGPLPRLIAAVAVSLALENGVQALVSPNALPFAFDAGEEVVLLGDSLIFRVIDAQVLLCAIACASGVWALTRLTRLGLGMRAIASQPVAAAINGVSVPHVMAATFFIAGALATCASTLQCMIMGQVHPMLGVAAGLKAFVAAVLGGIDSIWGALCGGLLLGVTESTLTHLGLSSWKEAMVFVLLIAVLLLRPQGLLGTPAVVKV